MLVYIVIFGITFFTLLFDNDKITWKTKKWIVGFDVLLLSLFYGLRNETGTDWGIYYNYFREANWSNIFSLHRYGNQTLEPGFVMMMVIPKTIFNSYPFYLLLSNLMRFFLFAVIAFRLTKYPIVGFVFLCSSVMLFPTRIPFAYTILLFGYIFIVERNFKAFVVTWLLASSIHISALIVFPVYFLYGIRVSVPVQIFLYIFTILFDSQICFVVKAAIPASAKADDESDIEMVNDFTGKVTHYTSFSGTAEQRSLPSFFIEFFVLMMANYALYRLKLTKKQRHDIQFFITTYLLSLLIKNAFFENLYYLERYKGYLDTLPLLVPLFLKSFYRYRLIVFAVFIAFLSYRLNKQMLNGAFSEYLIPYKLITHF
jgi:hypothetical protein